MVVRVCTPSGFLYDGLSDQYKTKEKKNKIRKERSSLVVVGHCDAWQLRV